MKNDKNYEKSNTVKLPEKVNQSACKHASQLYHSLREAKEPTEQSLQELSNAILKMYGVDSIPVRFSGQRPIKKISRGMAQTYGIHTTKGFATSIKIYKHTAKKHQIISSKSAVSTLIHEINHELDKRICLIQNSIHTKGFYLRIGQITKLLENDISF